MKYVLILLVALSVTSYGQLTDFIDDLDYSTNRWISYFDNKNHLDDIEGVWSLSVNRYMIHHGKEYEEYEEDYSRWKILKESYHTYSISAIDESISISFNAVFTKCIGEYTYHCDFLNYPGWEVMVDVEFDGNTIKYEYYADHDYLKVELGERYEHNMSLYWKFTWSKIYPKK